MNRFFYGIGRGFASSRTSFNYWVELIRNEDSLALRQNFINPPPDWENWLIESRRTVFFVRINSPLSPKSRNYFHACKMKVRAENELRKSSNARSGFGF